MSEDVPDYIAKVPADSGVHTNFPNNSQWTGLTQSQLNTLRSKLVNSIVAVIMQALTGFFAPLGPGVEDAFKQLTAWGNNLGSNIVLFFQHASNIAAAIGTDLAHLNLSTLLFDPLATFFKGGSQWAQDIFDDFSTALGGFTLAAGGAPRDYFTQSAIDTQTTLNQIQLSISALQGLGDNSANGGQSYLVDFSNMADAATLGADWSSTLTGSGTGQSFGILSAQADWYTVGSGTRTTFNFYAPSGDDTAGFTDTPYQLVGGLFTAKPGKRFIPGPLPWSTDIGSTTFYGSDELICRWDPVSGSCVRIKRDGDGTITLIWDDGTALHTMDVSSYDWKANTLYFLRAGNPNGNIREYTLLEGTNLKQIYTYTDTGAISYPGGFDPIADSYNGFGGGWADYRFSGTSGSPLKQFLLRDYTPATILGVIGRAYYSDPVSLLNLSATMAILPTGAIDSIGYASAGVSYTAGRTHRQTITILGSPTSGNFVPIIPGYGTYVAGVPRNATAATLQTALRTITGLGSVNVGGGPGPGTPYTVDFIVAGGGPVGLMTFTNTFGGGSGPSISAADTIVGEYDNCWTVRDKGTFGVTLFGERTSSGATPSPAVLVTPFVNGVQIRGAANFKGGDGYAYWALPLNAADRVQFGACYEDNPASLIGDVGGLSTSFDIVKLAIPPDPVSTM